MTVTPIDELRGVLPALISPLHKDGSADEAGIKRLVEHVIAGGVTGLLPLGSTGEGASLGERTRSQILRCVVEASAGRVPVICGVAQPNLEAARAAVAAASRLGPDLWRREHRPSVGRSHLRRLHARRLGRCAQAPGRVGRAGDGGAGGSVSRGRQSCGSPAGNLRALAGAAGGRVRRCFDGATPRTPRTLGAAFGSSQLEAWGPERLELGEGARWVGDRVVLVDIPTGRLLQADPKNPGQLRQLVKLDVPLGAVAPLADSTDEWIAACGTGIALIRAGGRLEWAP